ncbi:hypothetical protein KEGY108214_12685 [Kerstersia gyiorum]
MCCTYTNNLLVTIHNWCATAKAPSSASNGTIALQSPNTVTC